MKKVLTKPIMMKMPMVKQSYCRSGCIYKVKTDNFRVDYESIKENPLKRKTLLNNGEYLEFRFFSPANFRTEDNKYFSCDVKYFEENTELFAEIFEQVRFANRNTLNQIINCRLYNTIKRGDDNEKV